MRTAGSPGRGERGRVAARVRDLVGTVSDSDDGQAPAARTSAEPPGWVAGMRPPPRHGSDATGRWRDRVRWDPGRRGIVALALAAVAVLAATGWWLAAGRPSAMPIAVSGSSRPAPSGGPVPSASVSDTGPVPSATPDPAASAPAAPVVVDVAGRVRRPGVYTLSAGARIVDALQVAGGVRRRASTLDLNLAAPLQDGEQIVVGRPAPAAMPPGAMPPAATPAVSGSGAPAGPVDLNTATLEELEALPGVGPVLGQNILDWRAAHQRFTSVDQLGDVTGIGDVRMAQLRPLVTV